MQKYRPFGALSRERFGGGVGGLCLSISQPTSGVEKGSAFSHRVQLWNSVLLFKVAPNSDFDHSDNAVTVVNRMPRDQRALMNRFATASGVPSASSVRKFCR